MNEIRKAPSNANNARVDLQPNDFDDLVWEKGKDVIWESSLKCPCKQDGRGHLTTCINCGGSGYVFMNPVGTKMIIQSMNLTTKTSQWSLDKIGMANITTRSIDILGDMDRVTLQKSVSKISQVVRPKLFGDTLFSFVNYPISNVIDVFLFQKDKSKLVKLDNKQYHADANKIIIDKSLYSDSMSVSIRYNHKIQYFIVDVTREVRDSKLLANGSDDVSKFPSSVIGRRCHFIIKPENYTAGDIVDNSYEDLKTCDTNKS